MHPTTTSFIKQRSSPQTKLRKILKTLESISGLLSLKVDISWRIFRASFSTWQFEMEKGRVDHCLKKLGYAEQLKHSYDVSDEVIFSGEEVLLLLINNNLSKSQNSAIHSASLNYSLHAIMTLLPNHIVINQNQKLN